MKIFFFFLLILFIINYASVMGIFFDSILENFVHLLESSINNFASNALWNFLPQYLSYCIKAFFWFFVMLLLWNFFQQKSPLQKDNEDS